MWQDNTSVFKKHWNHRIVVAYKERRKQVNSVGGLFQNAIFTWVHFPSTFSIHDFLPIQPGHLRLFKGFLAGQFYLNWKLFSISFNFMGRFRYLQFKLDTLQCLDARHLWRYMYYGNLKCSPSSLTVLLHHDLLFHWCSCLALSYSSDFLTLFISHTYP